MHINTKFSKYDVKSFLLKANKNEIRCIENLIKYFVVFLFSCFSYVFSGQYAIADKLVISIKMFGTPLTSKWSTVVN